MKKNLTIAIPAFNEERTIEKTIHEAYQAAKRNATSIEILVVDDGSTDKTPLILKRLQTKKPIKIITHHTNQGFSGAIGDCYKFASKELVFFAPADGQFDFKELDIFLDAAKKSDVVLSNRDLKNVSLYRRVNTFFFRLIYRVLFSLPFTDVSSCILWKTSVHKNTHYRSAPASATISVEAVYQAKQAGYTITEVPIAWKKRRAGKEKGGNPVVALYTLLDMLKLWWLLRIRNK